jgi:hypothetical protein
MKKLIWLFLFIPFLAKAQVPVLRSSSSVTAEDSRLYILKNFRLPVFADTTEANLSKGLDSIGTLINTRGTKWVLIRVPSTGAFHKWDTLGGSGSGGGSSGDTVFLYQIGTAAGQIETLYAVDGNLRKSRWVPGYGTLPFLAPDSAAYIDIDTTSIAYKSWVISLFGTSINNLQQVIDNGNRLTRTDTIIGASSSGIPLYAFNIDSFSLVTINGSQSGGGFQAYGPGGESNFQVNQNNISEDVISAGVTGATISRNSGDSLLLQSYTFAGAPNGDTSKIRIKPDEILISTKESPFLNQIALLPWSTELRTYNPSGNISAFISNNSIDSTIILSTRNGIYIADPKPSGAIPAFLLKQQAAQINSFNLFWPSNTTGVADTLATLRDVRAGSGGGGGTGYSVTTAANTANYTVPTGRRIFVYLSDLTGQANRNAVLPAATTGDEFVFVNLNTDASGFFWTFTVGTVKDKDQSTITTLANLATYNLIYGGTNFQIH